MKPVLISALGLFLAGCTMGRGGSVEVPSSSDYLAPPKQNTAPRGSAEFCRTYAQQTANNRLRSSTRSRGRGPSGFDFYQAKDAGEQAAARCRAGRTN